MAGCGCSDSCNCVITGEPPISVDGIGTAIDPYIIRVSEVSDAQEALALARQAIPLSQKAAANGVATLDNTGKVPLSQLPPSSVVDVAALQAQVNGIDAQVDSMVANYATIEEIISGVHLAGAWSNAGDFIKTTANAHIQTIWTAPYACKVTALALVFEVYSIATSSTNYIQATVAKRTNSDQVGHNIAIKTTTQEALTARKAWTFDQSAWDATNSTFAKNDVLYVAFDAAGTGLMTYPVAVTFRVQPL